jgi:hypothetical protein
MTSDEWQMDSLSLFLRRISGISCEILLNKHPMTRGTRSSRRAGRPTRADGRRGVAGRGKSGGSNRRRSKRGKKRPDVTHKKGSAKRRKALRTRNVGRGRVRGRQSGGGGKESSFTARPIGRTLGVALAGQSPPAGERGAWEFRRAKPAEPAEGE